MNRRAPMDTRDLELVLKLCEAERDSHLTAGSGIAKAVDRVSCLGSLRFCGRALIGPVPVPLLRMGTSPFARGRWGRIPAPRSSWAPLIRTFSVSKVPRSSP